MDCAKYDFIRTLITLPHTIKHCFTACSCNLLHCTDRSTPEIPIELNLIGMLVI